MLQIHTGIIPRPFIDLSTPTRRVIRPEKEFPSSIQDQRSKILLPRRRHPPPKHRTLNLHIHLIKRVHNRLNPVLVHLRKELLDGLFCLRGGRVRGYGCAGSCSICNSGLRRGMQEEEFNIYSSQFISPKPPRRGEKERGRGIDFRL
jgi:hypothetical protein